MPDPSGTFDALEPRRKKVAIVGFASSTRLLAPYADPAWEIQGMNQLYRFVPRLTRWWEMHRREDWLADAAPGTDYLGWLRACPVPVYMIERHADIPSSIAFPFRQIVDDLQLAAIRPDLRERGYFHSSVDYMMALAIHGGFEEIGIWGVDMAHETEYCPGPETRVLTADLRWVEAAKLHVGDRVLAFDETPMKRADGFGSWRRWRCATVERTVELLRPSYRLTLADGTVIVSSAEHRWLTHAENENRWRRADELQTAHHRRGRPTKLVKLTDVWSEDRSWDAAYLAAAFDGEGHLSQHARHNDGASVTIGFSQQDNEMSHQVLTSLAALEFKTAKTKPNGTVHTYVVHGGRSEALRFLGQVRPRRLLAHFDPLLLGRIRPKSYVAVEHAEFIGEQSVIGLGTSEGTFVAEGFASHNSMQKPSLSFWMGLAHGRGVRVTVPTISALLNPMNYRYGYDPPPRHELEEQLGSRQRALADRRAQLVTELNAVDGALQENAHWTAYARQVARGATAPIATSTVL